MREMRCARVQDGCKVAVMFEHQQTFSGNPVYGRTRRKHTLADQEMAGLDQTPDAPVEARAAVIEAAMPHQLEQLVVAHEAQVSHLAQQGNVALGVDDHAILGVTHFSKTSVQCPLVDELQRHTVAQVGRWSEPPNSQRSSHPIEGFHQ